MKMTSSSKLTWLISTIFLIVCVSAISATNCGNDPDFRKNTFELIANKNYPVKNYTITTSDNYVLNIFRIPNGNGYKGNNTKKPIMLLGHGLLGSSDDWVFNFPSQSLGFIAYDKGYDVWILNYRGDTYARTNTKIKNTNPDFWKFSWDEMALIDLPTTIDYVLAKTGQSQLYYVGHSMGTTNILALLSDKTEYQKKVKKVALLAPVGSTFYSTFALFILSPLRDLLVFISVFTSGTFGEFLPNSAAYEWFVQSFCTNDKFNFLCKGLAKLEKVSGLEFNESRLCVYMSAYPAGSSANTVIHYAQERDAQVFQKYDYGLFGNIQKYGTKTPPQYNVRLIKTPVGLYSSAFDEFVDQRDVDFLRRNLGTKPADDYVIRDIKSFHHFAFTRGLNASDVVYSRIFTLFSSD